MIAIKKSQFCHSAAKKMLWLRKYPHMSISGISKLLLIQSWPNFKGRILGPYLKDANCYGDICPYNICPCYICQNKQYLCCYWSNFDKTFWTQFMWSHNQNVLGQTFSRPKILLGFLTREFIGPKKMLNSNCFGPNFFSNLKLFFRPKIFLEPKLKKKSDQNFFWTHNFFQKLFSGLKIILPPNFRTQKFFPDPNFFRVPKFSEQKFYWFKNIL